MVQDIVNNVREELDKTSLLTPSLLAGDLGKIIFLFYASRCGFINVSEPEQYLNQLLADLFKQSFGGSYCNGLSGLCIAMDLLEEDNFVNNMSIDLFNHSKRLLETCLTRYMHNNFDFLHGSIGIAFCFLKFMDRSIEASRQLDTMIDNIDKSSKHYRNLNGSHLLYDNGKGVLCPNLSLSHGISSTIIFIARTYKKTLNCSTKAKCKKLLSGFVDYLRSQIVDPLTYGSYTLAYPIEMGYSYKSRLAWCYGDIGVSIALKEIGEVLKDNTCIDISQEINNYIANFRIDAVENGIKDAGLCHGVSGIIQYLKSLINCPADKALDYWNSVIGSYSRLINGRTEFGRYNPETDSFDPCLNLLEGDSGIGMCLLNESKFLNSILLYNE